ncbi:MAG TPA: sugar phosphate nucleotidyltransferase [Candidatus Woesebacteria bacterium]|nr:sugar phosphate nucleotidyltransferase [Candidatus Woesebacteria bacterium]
MKIVIICGGVGTKMWPESQPTSPKHFLPLLNGKSIFELGWEGLRKKYSPDEIFLQTNQVQAEIAMRLVPEIIKENIFIEPEMRNHGPATGFAAAQLIKRGLGDEPFILVQADVLREPADKFNEMIEEMNKLALNTDKYITGGIVPSSIVRGVDYLVKGNLVTEEGGIKIYEVADYIDRSEEEKIKQYLGSDKLLLHANHTSMTPNNLLKMYQQSKPEWQQASLAIANGANEIEEYAKMPKGGIEEATIPMYKNGGALVVELPFEWIDFGTWESVAKYLGDQNENKIEVEAGNNFVRSKKKVAIIGLNDLVVIDSPEGVLVCPKSMSGKVGEVPKILENM